MSSALFPQHPGDSGAWCQDEKQSHDCESQWALVPSGELAESVHRARRACWYRFIIEIALQIRGESAGRFVAPVTVLIQRLHHDPVQLAAEKQAQAFRIALALRRNGGGCL